MERKYWRQIGRPPDYVEPEKKAKAKRTSKKAKAAEPETPQSNPVKITKSQRRMLQDVQANGYVLGEGMGKHQVRLEAMGLIAREQRGSKYRLTQEGRAALGAT